VTGRMLKMFKRRPAVPAASSPALSAANGSAPAVNAAADGAAARGQGNGSTSG
jgi:hypothetical protein